jgi:Tfp pilus assembly protein PilN
MSITDLLLIVLVIIALFAAFRALRENHSFSESQEKRIVKLEKNDEKKDAEIANLKEMVVERDKKIIVLEHDLKLAKERIELLESLR